MAAEKSEDKPGQQQPPKFNPAENYQPMGVLIVNWCQLFPWLVSGYSNDIPKDNQALEMIQLRTILQDFITLQSLYARLSHSGLSFQGHTPRWFGSMSDAFGAGASELSEYSAAYIGEKNSEKRESPLACVKRARSGLGPDAMKIHDVWQGLPLLRGCELGLGVHIRRRQPGSPLFEGVTAIKMEYVRAISQPLFVPQLEPSLFDPVAGNYVAFSKSVKGFPVILPTGEIAVYLQYYVSNKETKEEVDVGGILCLHKFVDSHVFCVARNIQQQETQNPSALRFQERWWWAPSGYKQDYLVESGVSAMCLTDPKTPGQPLSSRTMSKPQWSRFPAEPGMVYREYLSASFSYADRNYEVNLFPIPFSAAKSNVKWNGCALAAGTGSLDIKLEDVRRELEKRNRWSFDSDAWKDRQWRANKTYSLTELKPTYLGVIPKPDSII
jgi:hypothetical protein